MRHLLASLALLTFACGGDGPTDPTEQFSRLENDRMTEDDGTFTLRASTDPPDSRPFLDYGMTICVEGFPPPCDTMEGSQSGPFLAASVVIRGTNACVEIDWGVQLVYVTEDFGERVVDTRSGDFESTSC